MTVEFQYFGRTVITVALYYCGLGLIYGLCDTVNYSGTEILRSVFMYTVIVSWHFSTVVVQCTTTVGHPGGVSILPRVFTERWTVQLHWNVSTVNATTIQYCKDGRQSAL